VVGPDGVVEDLLAGQQLAVLVAAVRALVPVGRHAVRVRRGPPALRPRPGARLVVAVELEAAEGQVVALDDDRDVGPVGLRRPLVGEGRAGDERRGEAGQPADLFWVAVGLLIPFFLAAGNIYRTFDWPRDAGPIELAVGSHLAAAAMLLAGLLSIEGAGSFSLLSGMPIVVLAQMTAAAAMFAFFFRLQAVGGPVYLSQIGYVAAAIGLVAGVLFLGERYQLLTWAGAVIVTIGVIMTTKAQKLDR
jgi:uncharacterized membrane protein